MANRAPMHSYVCDRCGNLWQAYRSKKCPACGHDALWQFGREDAARNHSERIKNPAETVTPL